MKCRGTCFNAHKFREWKSNTYHYNDNVSDSERVSMVDCYQIVEGLGNYQEYGPLFVWFCWNVEFNKPQADFTFMHRYIGGGGISSLRKELSSCSCGNVNGIWKYRRGHSPDNEPQIDLLFRDMLEGKVTPISRIEGLTHPSELIRSVFNLKEKNNDS